MKTPTKIKARKMWRYTSGQGDWLSEHAYGNDPHEKPVYVLDASRYGDCVTQMGAAIRHSIQRGDTEHQAAMSALRSIGITKGAK